jgi:chromatin remodeling complex protein RSC6
MPRATSKPTASAPEPVVVAEVKAKKTKAIKVEASIPAPVVVVEDSSVVQEVIDIEASVAAQSLEFQAKLNQMSTIISSLKSEYKMLEKKWLRELKASQKANSKRKRKTGNRAPSGFVKPTKISDELAQFLEKPVGTEMARTDVTKEINQYIRLHKLQDEKNGRRIHPDTKLSSLLKLNKTDELTYFNLQKYMSHHFAKAVKAVPAAAV